jgi:hypothetical protein
MTNFHLNAECAKVTQKTQRKNHLNFSLLRPLRNLCVLCVQKYLTPANLPTGAKE